MPHPLMDMWIPTPNITDITLEMLDVDGVKANGSRVQSYISFCDVWARQQIRS